MRVLLIEDDRMIGEGLSHGLSAEGYTVDWVRDGATAATAMRDGGHALVLLDLGLPGGDGLRVLRSARAAGIDDLTMAAEIVSSTGMDARPEEIVHLVAGMPGSSRQAAR